MTTAATIETTARFRADFVAAHQNLQAARAAKTAAWQALDNAADEDAAWDAYDAHREAVGTAERQLIQTGDAWLAAYDKRLDRDAGAALATVAANPGTSAYRSLVKLYEAAAERAA